MLAMDRIVAVEPCIATVAIAVVKTIAWAISGRKIDGLVKQNITGSTAW